MGNEGRAWRILPTAGLAVWVGTVIAVAVVAAEPGDDSIVTTTFVAGGAVYFSLLFGGIAIWMRRSQRRARHDLYERLAVAPLEPGELRAATRPMATIGYVYVAFGAIVTGCGLVAVAVGTDAAGPILVGMVGIVGLWVVFAVYALARSWATADAVVRPLGLQLTEIPTFHRSLIGDMTWMSGAASYEGTRHGRSVSISQTADAAATVVGGGDAGDHVQLPRTPQEMAALTGEPVRHWRNVEVRHEAGAVIVTRRARGAGGWFLHDLLLAEAVAGTRA